MLLTIKVLLLMGGLLSADGVATSRGMVSLQHQIERQVPGVVVHRYLWKSFAKYCRDAQSTPFGTKLAVVAYSGGGMSATYLATNKYCPHVNIDLMITYDPSPSWNMQPLWTNVRRAVCYCNTKKMNIPPYVGRRAIGGGQLRYYPQAGKTVDKVMIRQNHLAVQYNKQLHARTIWELRRL